VKLMTPILSAKLNAATPCHIRGGRVSPAIVACFAARLDRHALPERENDEHEQAKAAAKG
jgi:hypothetical protein